MRIILIIILLSAISAKADQLEDKPVVLAAPSFWCPYACKSSTKQLGFAVEIALEALRSQGIKVNYLNMPYLRIKKQLNTGKVDGIVAAYKDEISNAIFPQHPVSSSSFCFFSYQNIDFFWTGVTDALRPYKLLVTGGYSYFQKVDAYIADTPLQVEILKGNNITARGFKMLSHNRADLFLEDMGLYGFMIKKGKIKPAINRGCLKTKTIGFLALSPVNAARSQKIADAYDKGFIGLANTGRLQAILDEYNIMNFYTPAQE